MNAGEKITLGTLTYKRGISEYSAQVWIASQGYIPDMHITFEQPIVRDARRLHGSLRAAGPIYKFCHR